MGIPTLFRTYRARRPCPNASRAPPQAAVWRRHPHPFRPSLHPAAARLARAIASPGSRPAPRPGLCLGICRGHRRGVRLGLCSSRCKLQYTKDKRKVTPAVLDDVFYCNLPNQQIEDLHVAQARPAPHRTAPSRAARCCGRRFTAALLLAAPSSRPSMRAGTRTTHPPPPWSSSVRLRSVCTTRTG